MWLTADVVKSHKREIFIEISFYFWAVFFCFSLNNNYFSHIYKT